MNTIAVSIELVKNYFATKMAELYLPSSMEKMIFDILNQLDDALTLLKKKDEEIEYLKNEKDTTSHFSRGANASDYPELREIVSLANKGHKIAAIKELRKISGLSLKDSKILIEAMKLAGDEAVDKSMSY